MTLNHADKAFYPTPAGGICEKWLTLKTPEKFWNALKKPEDP